MFIKKYLFIPFFFIALSVPSFSQAGLGVEIGPFDLNIGGGIAVEKPAMVEDPICQAIRETDLIEIFVETESEEDGMKTSRLVIEPYTLAFNDNGELILRGYRIEGIGIPEETQKQGEIEDGFGFVGGMYTVLKGQEIKDIKINRIRNIRVLENTDFVARDPKEFDERKDKEEFRQVLCTIAQ